MKNITGEEITYAVSNAFKRANVDIPASIEEKICNNIMIESGDTPKAILKQIADNYELARKDRLPLCQDCGMAIVFAEVGQEVYIKGDFENAVQEGIRKAYTEYYLRKSVVKDPIFDRSNTEDNTPGIIYTRLIPGDQLKITVAAKGFGSENCSNVRMFLPADTIDDIKEYIVETVKQAGPNTCPPVIVGVGIGGTMDKAAVMAKQATIRDISIRNSDIRYEKLENEILQMINRTGIGPGGFGGRTTALAVNIEQYATHIASVPVAVNLCCHVSRHAAVIL
ncbi:MAG: fumarate hydratase [Eubacteriaceae bacterium]|jgi:fumarate hydratase subunit alpha|nr:fumarate hydratase [Eubacteriaceae bacterium]